MTITGLVVKAHSGFFTVQPILPIEAPETRYMCNAAGRLTKKRHVEDALAVGDHVVFEPVKSEGFVNGRIIEVAKRVRTLSRKDPIASVKDRDIRQVIVANLDLVVFVFACAEPDFHPRLLDRYLVGAEAQKLPVIIAVTKIDLVPPGRAQELFALYEKLGYEVIYTSVKDEDDPGLAHLRERLRGRLSVLTGKSGVGKSSLLNSLKPGLAQQVGAMSESWGKGKHTTVVPELIALDEHSWIADTPGIRSYAVWDVEAEELDAYFREIAPLVSKCEFSDCSHVHEPGCAVRAAVENGIVSESRYDSYLRLREELGKQKRW